MVIFINYKYKTELHCHSSYVSLCSGVDAKSIVEQYIECGYTSLVITDHLNAYTFSHDRIKDASDREKMEYFLDGWRRVKEYAAGRLNVLLGAEVRFPSTGGTDFLIYGPDEDFFLNNPDMYMHERFWTGSLARNNGCLFIQAHPFRFNMMLAEDWVVDGIEVFNGHPGADSHNRMAEEWKKEFPRFIVTSGSDHHEEWQTPDAGILTKEPITNNKQLVEILKSGDYQLFCDADAMEKSRASSKS